MERIADCSTRSSCHSDRRTLKTSINLLLEFHMHSIDAVFITRAQEIHVLPTYDTKYVRFPLQYPMLTHRRSSGLELTNKNVHLNAFFCLDPARLDVLPIVRFGVISRLIFHVYDADVEEKTRDLDGSILKAL